MPWSDLYGNHVLKAIRTDVRHPFDGSANGIAVQFDEMTVLVFENPDDGYRSSANEPIIMNAPLYSLGCSPEYIHAPVLVRGWTTSQYGDGCDGIEVIDTRNGKTVLTLGTDNVNDYYPSYTADWRPQDLAENAAAQT